MLPVIVDPESQTLPVKWNAFLGGYDFGTQETNGQYILNRIPQVFDQSPYLETE